MGRHARVCRTPGQVGENFSKRSLTQRQIKILNGGSERQE